MSSDVAARSDVIETYGTQRRLASFLTQKFCGGRTAISEIPGGRDAQQIFVLNQIGFKQSRIAGALVERPGSIIPD